jgi:tRNA(adenine34) deaminase
MNSRRSAIAIAVVAVLPTRLVAAQAGPGGDVPSLRWYQAALRMRELAESWGDQSYGAVLVLDGRLVGEGPSRVIKNSDVSAHAEREAMRDAQRRLGAASLSGAVLYSTSRPCSACEAFAARAGVRRMYFGSSLSDGGAPSAGTQ